MYDKNLNTAKASRRRARIKADPERYAKYLIKRRVQKARARAKKKAMKAPRTLCRKGLHPYTAGGCMECRKDTSNTARAARNASKPIAPPKPPALTSAEQRALDPIGYRAKEREHEAQYLGKPVLSRTEHLEQLAAKGILQIALNNMTPEDLGSKHKEVCKRGHLLPEGKCKICAAAARSKRPKGPRKRNIQTARKRADNLASMLRRKGVPEENIPTILLLQAALYRAGMPQIAILKGHVVRGRDFRKKENKNGPV